MFKQSLIATAIAVASISASAEQGMPSNEELWQLIKEQQKEITELKTQVQVTDTKVNATADAVEQSGNAQSSKLAEWVEKTKIGGYGEHHFNHFEDKDD